MARRHTRSAPQNGNHETPIRRQRATTIAPEGRLVLAGSDANSRLFVYMIGNYLHRLERERRSLYFGDLDLARVAEIIGAAGVEPGMRDAAFREQHRNFDSVVGVEGQRAVNATSIASATGIPRETVRRKLQRLLKLASSSRRDVRATSWNRRPAASGAAGRLRARHSADRAFHERMP